MATFCPEAHPTTVGFRFHILAVRFEQDRIFALGQIDVMNPGMAGQKTILVLVIGKYFYAHRSVPVSFLSIMRATAPPTSASILTTALSNKAGTYRHGRRPITRWNYYLASRPAPSTSLGSPQWVNRKDTESRTYEFVGAKPNGPSYSAIFEKIPEPGGQF